VLETQSHIQSRLTWRWGDETMKELCVDNRLCFGSSCVDHITSPTTTPPYRPNPCTRPIHAKCKPLKYPHPAQTPISPTDAPSLVIPIHTIPLRRLLMIEHTTRILRVLVDGIAAQIRSRVVLRQKFFDLPVVLLLADGEFEVFFCYGVPVLHLISGRVWEVGGRERTLYTIMTAKRLSSVAKKRPSM